MRILFTWHAPELTPPATDLAADMVIHELNEARRQKRLRHLRYLRRRALQKIRNLHNVRLPALETCWLSRTTRRLK